MSLIRSRQSRFKLKAFSVLGLIVVGSEIFGVAYATGSDEPAPGPALGLGPFPPQNHALKTPIPPGSKAYDNCSLGDAASSVSTCMVAIRKAQARIDFWKRASDAHQISNATFVQRRIELQKQILDENAVLNRLKEKASFLKSEDAVAPDEGLQNPYLFSDVWSSDTIVHDQSSSIQTVNYTGSSSQQILNSMGESAPSGVSELHGQFTVPLMFVPGSAVSPSNPNGVCSGVSKVHYFESWWLGIAGANGAGPIYQTGVDGYLDCSKGSTVPVVTYRAWVEDYPTDPVEIFLTRFDNKISAGDTMTVEIDSNFVAGDNPPGFGQMTYELGDTTAGIDTGLKVRPQDSGPPSASAEAIAERHPNSTSGGNYYYAAPQSNAVSQMFSNVTFVFKYIITYSNAPAQATLNLSANDSDCDTAGGGFCQTNLLFNTTNNGCDDENGTGPTATTGGYNFNFLGTPPAKGCLTPNM